MIDSSISLDCWRAAVHSTHDARGNFCSTATASIPHPAETIARVTGAGEIRGD
jgi:hypothetical protein